MVLNDVITLAMGNSEPLNRIRPQLREFVSQRVLQGAAPTEENVSQAVGRLLREFRPFLESMVRKLFYEFYFNLLVIFCYLFYVLK